MKIKLKIPKPRNPLVSSVMKKSVQRHQPKDNQDSLFYEEENEEYENLREDSSRLDQPPGE
jgi:hypothetical protein